MDYTKQARDKILSYMEVRGGKSTVDDIMKYSFADKLRVYNILQQLEMDGKIVIIERAYFGAPTMVKINEKVNHVSLGCGLNLT